MDEPYSNALGTILDFKGNRMQFRFFACPIWIDWLYKGNGDIEKRQFALIGLKDELTGFEIIHPISDFILSNWQSHRYNTQRKHSIYVSAFLNFLLENKRKLRIKALKDLNPSHGVKFLNYLTRMERSLDTVKSAERTLSKFYQFLSKKGCLNESIDFVKKEGPKGQYYYESPFRNVLYPSKEISKVEHTFPLKYIPLLLEIANLIAKPIVLGIYFQIFGGLRVSEVVNIRRGNLKRNVGNGRMLVNLKKQYFRTDIKDGTGGGYVKRSRDQQVLHVKDWFDVFYEEHLDLFEDKYHSGAMFINRDGKAMTEKSYRQYFNKVKKYFIRYLSEQGDIDDKILAEHLRKMDWSTHIGRGIFSNMLADEAKDPFEIAFARGDKDINSALVYIAKNSRMNKKLEEKFMEMHNSYIPKLIERQGKGATE